MELAPLAQFDGKVLDGLEFCSSASASKASAPTRTTPSSST
jgi:hypothetical protein